MAHAAAHLKKARELEQSSEYKALQKARERRRRQRERAERKRLVRSRSCNDSESVGFKRDNIACGRSKLFGILDEMLHFNVLSSHL